ncbi:hypothetical protein H5J25_02180 [Sphingomonas aliaeris]|uniref:Uncharacterized protein n=1 Tax=Sphingomonas aliaeris TaxID=2759526 RepID=A0A974NVM3_9SPHN|nr:hypothetical protein [Sphingomonas aliaeris]QQV77632.1 hypothetical protein H5J25_02180 [Sphingomonas aliaeris]
MNLDRQWIPDLSRTARDAGTDHIVIDVRPNYHGDTRRTAVRHRGERHALLRGMDGSRGLIDRVVDHAWRPLPLSAPPARLQ